MTPPNKPNTKNKPPKPAKTFGLGQPSKYPNRIVPAYKAIVYGAGPTAIYHYSIDAKSSISTNINVDRGLNRLMAFLIEKYSAISNLLDFGILIVDNVDTFPQPKKYYYKNGSFISYEVENQSFKADNTPKKHAYMAWCLPLPDAQIGSLKKGANGKIYIFPNTNSDAPIKEQLDSLMITCHNAIKQGLTYSKFYIYHKSPSNSNDILIGYFDKKANFIRNQY